MSVWCLCVLHRCVHGQPDNAVKVKDNHLNHDQTSESSRSLYCLLTTITNISMHLCMYNNMYVSMYSCTVITICIHIFVYVCMYVCMYVYFCVCMYICMYCFVYVCMYVCMCVSVCVCMYVCLCVCMLLLVDHYASLCSASSTMPHCVVHPPLCLTV